MSWGIVAGIAVGAVGSVSAANSQSKAISRAAAAEAEAARANIAAAEAERGRNEALFQPYLAQEDQARARQDALYFGQGSYGAAQAALAPTGASLEQTLRQQNPTQDALWDFWERAGNSDTNGHRTTYGNFEGFIRREYPQLLAAAQAPIQNQDAPNAPGGQTTLTRDDVLAEIDQTAPSRMANEFYAGRRGLADETYSGANTLADEEFDDLWGVADRNYGDAYSLAGDARSGRRGVADANLGSRLALEDQSYAAWLPLSQRAEQDSIDLNFSRGGVTGLVGQTRAGVGETQQNAAMERNLRYLTGRQAAHEPYYGDVTAAENTYWGDVGAATGERGDARAYATGARAQRYNDAFSQRQGAYGSAYDQYSGDRFNAYGDYTALLADRLQQGERGRRNIASGGQATLGITTAQNTNAGRAAADAAYGRGAVTQQLYGDLARIAGNAYGSITNRNPRKSATVGAK